MAWNEPGNNKPHDPWNDGGKRQQGRDGADDGMKQFQDMIRNIFGGGPSGRKHSGNGMLGMIGIVVGILLSLWILIGFYQLDEKEQAVVLRLGIYKEVVGAGFHWNPPIIDKVFRENVTEVRTHATKGQMLTADENIVEVNLSVQYNIADLKKYKLSIREPEIAMQEATDSALRHVVGSSKIDDVLTTGREKIAVDVKERLSNYLDAYQTGIRVSSVNVEDTRAPEEVKASFDDVSKAREDEDRFKNEAQTYANQIVPESRGKAQRILEEARAYREQVVARAEGEAMRFRKLLAEYKKAPAVTRERLYIETMQQVMQNSTKVMVDVKKGNNMMYLPLDKIAQGSGTIDPGAQVSPAQLEALQRQVEALKAEMNNSSNRRREVRP